MRDWCQRFYHVFTCFKKKFVHVFNVFNFFPTFFTSMVTVNFGPGFSAQVTLTADLWRCLATAKTSIKSGLWDCLLELVRSKWVPTLFCGLEYYQLSNADLRSLYFTFNRLFTKLFKTKSIDVVKSCQSFSGSEQWRIQGGRGAMPPPNQTKIIFFCRMHQKRHYESKMEFFSSAQPLQTIRTAKYNQF